MKRVIENYTFNAIEKTISSSELNHLSSIQLITNVTTNQIIYNFAKPGLAGSLVDSTLTLDCDTTMMSNSDELQILCEVDVPVDVNGCPIVSLGTTISGEDTVNDSLRVEGTAVTIIGSAGGANEDLIASTEMLQAGYGRFSLQISGTWVGTITVSCSNDNTQFTNAVVFNNASTNALAAASIVTNGTYFGYINFKYLRVRMTSYTSGTATATLVPTSAPGGQQTIGAQVSQTGTWNFGPVIAGSSSVNSVASSTTVVTLMVSNTNRKQGFIYNNSSAALYLKLGSGASTTSFTIKLLPNEIFALPTPPIYSGIITGVWETADGAALATEIS